MNARLQNLIVEAEARLGPEEQDRLADIVEHFVVSRTTEVTFTPEEMAGCAGSTRSRSRRPTRARWERFFRQRG